MKLQWWVGWSLNNCVSSILTCRVSSMYQPVSANISVSCLVQASAKASPAINFYSFRHHMWLMLSDLTPYALCHILHPFILCLSIDLIFIVIPDVICLLTPHPESHWIYAYLSITHLWLHPQFRSSAAHHAHLSLLASYLLSCFIHTPHLIIQSDGTILSYLV